MRKGITSVGLLMVNATLGCGALALASCSSSSSSSSSGGSSGGSSSGSVSGSSSGASSSGASSSGASSSSSGGSSSGSSGGSSGGSSSGSGSGSSGASSDAGVNPMVSGQVVGIPADGGAMTGLAGISVSLGQAVGADGLGNAVTATTDATGHWSAVATQPQSGQFSFGVLFEDSSNTYNVPSVEGFTLTGPYDLGVIPAFTYATTSNWYQADAGGLPGSEGFEMGGGFILVNLIPNGTTCTASVAGATVSITGGDAGTVPVLYFVDNVPSTVATSVSAGNAYAAIAYNLGQYNVGYVVNVTHPTCHQASPDATGTITYGNSTKVASGGTWDVPIILE
jgi:hypothetical protein